MKLQCSLAFCFLALAASSTAFADDANETKPTVKNKLDEITVVGSRKTYATSHVTEGMKARRSANASVNDVVRELPGIIVEEGDAYGSADWSTNIRMRGFDTNDQQIGSTIDGMPNGGSGYGGGSKANRYLDVLDLNTVEVSQGTADISSRSNEALGGTLNYISSDPTKKRNFSMLNMIGSQQAHKYRFRYDTGEIAPNTYAFISGSAADNKDVYDQKANAKHDYLTTKIISDVNDYKISGFASFNDANESEFSNVSLKNYYANPTHDGLEMTWTGIPQIDQNYRAVSRALRKNLFSYIKVGKDFGDFAFNTGAYYHRMSGRGDWMPPYVTDVDGDGNLSRDLSGGTIEGAYHGEDIYFVNAGTTTPATLINGCKGRYGLDAETDPNCYQGNPQAVSSYRTSTYSNRRAGFTADVDYKFDLGAVKNKVRAGLWYEKYDSRVTRGWHLVQNPAVSPAFNRTPYWNQYHTQTLTHETVLYVQENASYGPLTGSLGVKQYNVNKHFMQPVGNGKNVSLHSKSDPLLYAGVNYQTPLDGLELFTGYSENYKALNSDVLSNASSKNALKNVKPETAKNIELGFKFKRHRFTAAATAYKIDFSNRILKISQNVATGIDYKEAAQGNYLNVGGQKSKGIELMGAYQLNDLLRLSGSYTLNDSKYKGTGYAALDKDNDIYPGNRVYGQPMRFFTIAADYSGDVLNSGISLRHVGNRYINADNSAVAPDYNVSDAYIGVDYHHISREIKAMHVRMTVNNLFDKHYISNVGTNNVLPGAPRTISVAVSFDTL